MSKRKVIVYGSRVDPTIVKFTAEKMRYKLFSKIMGLVQVCFRKEIEMWLKPEMSRGIQA